MVHGNDSNSTGIITNSAYNAFNKINLSGTSAVQTPPIIKTTNMDFGNNLNSKCEFLRRFYVVFFFRSHFHSPAPNSKK